MDKKKPLANSFPRLHMISETMNKNIEDLLEERD